MTQLRASVLLAAVLACASGPAMASPTGDEPDHSYTYLAKNDVAVFGDSKGVERAQRYRQGDAPVLWFQEAGREYIVRDPDTITRLSAAWRPERALSNPEVCALFRRVIAAGKVTPIN